MRSISIALLFAVLIPFSSANAGNAAVITAAELLELIEAGKAPVIVDVRSRAEFNAGHVPGAMHVSFWSAYWDADRIPVSGHDPVVVYCAHGPRASVAGWALNRAGIPNVIQLDGHMSGWRRQKLPEVEGEDASQ